MAAKVARIGSLDYAKRKLVVTTSRAKRSAGFIAQLQVLDRIYGPELGAPRAHYVPLANQRISV